MLQLPLFPLQTVLFPGMPLYLHIFEPRYRLMIYECMEKDAPFGVALIQQGVEAYGPPATPYRCGCTARVANLEKLPDDRMNLTAVGEDRFRIVELDHSQPYLVGTVEIEPMENPHPLDVLRGTVQLRGQVRTYLDYLARINREEMDLTGIELPGDTQGLLYMAASLLQLPTSEKQPLLEAPTASDLLNQMMRLYRREIAMMNPVELAGEERARKSSWLN